MQNGQSKVGLTDNLHMSLVHNTSSLSSEWIGMGGNELVGRRHECMWMIHIPEKGAGEHEGSGMMVVHLGVRADLHNLWFLREPEVDMSALNNTIGNSLDSSGLGHASAHHRTDGGVDINLLPGNGFRIKRIVSLMDSGTMVKVFLPSDPGGRDVPAGFKTQ